MNEIEQKVSQALTLIQSNDQENAVEIFCKSQKISKEELDSYFSYRYMMDPPKYISTGLCMMEGMTLLQKLYRGLSLKLVIQYENVPKYFFVHISAIGGYYEACEIEGQSYYLPCVDCRGDKPIQIIERGGKMNMRRVSPDIFLCTKISRSTTSLTPSYDEVLLNFDVPVTLQIDPMDMAAGSQFSMGKCISPSRVDFPLLGFYLDLPNFEVGDYALIAQDEHTNQWCYIDSISKNRHFLNANMLGLYGQKSTGWQILYSISSTHLCLKNDLAGVLNRFKMDFSKKMVYPSDFPLILRQRFEQIFPYAAFDVERMFGSLYDFGKLHQIIAQNMPQIVSAKETQQSNIVIAEQKGVLFVRDVVRGTYFSNQSDYNIGWEKVVPFYLRQQIQNFFEGQQLSLVWPQLIRSLSQSYGLELSVYSKLIFDPESLTDNEADQIYFKMFFADLRYFNGLFYNKNQVFNCVVMDRIFILIVRNGPLFVNFPQNVDYIDFVDKSTYFSGLNVHYYFLSTLEIMRILRLNYHICWTKKDVTFPIKILKNAAH